MEIGKKISFLRKNKGLTQKELADKLSVTDKAISRWESGVGNPDLNTLPSIAKLFGVSIDYLLSDDTDIPNNDEGVKPQQTLNVEKKPNKKPLWIILTSIVALLIVVGLIFTISFSIKNNSLKNKYLAGINHLEAGEYYEAKEIFESLNYKDSNDKKFVTLGLIKLSEAKLSGSEELLNSSIEMIVTAECEINTHYEGNGRSIKNEEYRYDEVLTKSHYSLLVVDSSILDKWEIQYFYFYQNQTFLYLSASWK